MDGNADAPRHMTRWELAVDLVKRRLWMWRRRYIPFLVWWGDEIDVKVTLRDNKLPSIEGASPEIAAQAALQALSRGSFYEVEKLMREVGISFDTGMGFGGRDWEWDYSLSGPISVTFKGRAQNPERRA